jgi:hypothetical protein
MFDQKKEIFRKVALDRLSSPEQLDTLMRVTTPQGWLALFGAALLVIFAALWGIFGTLASSVNAQGILLRGENIINIEAPEDGQLAEITVRVGDLVADNQIIGTLDVLGEEVEIRSPGSGKVVDLRVNRGSFVPAGYVLLSLEDVSKPLQAVFFLPVAEGQRLRVGMPAQITVATVRREEYGVLYGTVSSVGEFPMTVDAMYRVLGSEELVESLSVDGAPIQIRVDLTLAPESPSGLKWSSPVGPPTAPGSGTPITASITLSESRPISLLFASIAIAD